MNTDLNPFFTHSLLIECTVNNESLTWDDWLVVSATSKKIREVVLSLKPFQIFVLGRLIIPRLKEYTINDEKYRKHVKCIEIELLRAKTGDFIDVLGNLLWLNDQKVLSPFDFAQRFMKLPKIYAKSHLDNPNKHIAEIMAAAPLYREAFVYDVIRALLKRNSQDSIDYALELAEYNNNATYDLYYSYAIRDIAFAKLKALTNKAFEEAEQLANRNILPITSLVIYCQIWQLQSKDVLALIRESVRNNPALKSSDRLCQLAEWWCSNNQDNPQWIQGCVEIINLVSGDFRVSILRLITIFDDSPNTSARLREMLSSIPQSSLSTQSGEIAHFRNSCEKLIALLSHSLNSRFRPEYIRYILILPPGYHQDFFIKVLNKISKVNISGIGNPVYFIAMMHEILNSDPNPEGLTYEQMIVNITSI